MAEEVLDENVSKLILERLKAFGDSLLEDDNRAEKETNNHTNSNGINQRKKNKKKKKLQKQKEEKKFQTNDKFLDFDKEIELFKKSESVNSKQTVKKTKRKKKKVNTEKKVEVIVFHDPSKRKITKEETLNVDSKDGIISLKKAKLDVHQFGLSGFAYEDKEKMELQRAIRLGARPPKKEYMNYKELIKKKKEESEAEEKQKEINRKLGIKVSKKPEKIVLKNKGFWVDPTQQRGVYIDGQVGKFRHGMQVVSKKDLKLKSSKSKTHKKMAIKL